MALGFMGAFAPKMPEVSQGILTAATAQHNTAPAGVQGPDEAQAYYTQAAGAAMQLAQLHNQLVISQDHEAAETQRVLSNTMLSKEMQENISKMDHEFAIGSQILKAQTDYRQQMDVGAQNAQYRYKSMTDSANIRGQYQLERGAQQQMANVFGGLMNRGYSGGQSAGLSASMFPAAGVDPFANAQNAMMFLGPNMAPLIQAQVGMDYSKMASNLASAKQADMTTQLMPAQLLLKQQQNMLASLNASNNFNNWKQFIPGLDTYAEGLRNKSAANGYMTMAAMNQVIADHYANSPILQQGLQGMQNAQDPNTGMIFRALPAGVNMFMKGIINTFVPSTTTMKPGTSWVDIIMRQGDPQYDSAANTRYNQATQLWNQYGSQLSQMPGFEGATDAKSFAQLANGSVLNQGVGLYLQSSNANPANQNAYFSLLSHLGQNGDSNANQFLQQNQDQIYQIQSSVPQNIVNMAAAGATGAVISRATPAALGGVAGVLESFPHPVARVLGAGLRALSANGEATMTEATANSVRTATQNSGNPSVPSAGIVESSTAQAQPVLQRFNVNPINNPGKGIVPPGGPQPGQFPGGVNRMSGTAPAPNPVTPSSPMGIVSGGQASPTVLSPLQGQPIQMPMAPGQGIMPSIGPAQAVTTGNPGTIPGGGITGGVPSGIGRPPLQNPGPSIPPEQMIQSLYPQLKNEATSWPAAQSPAIPTGPIGNPGMTNQPVNSPAIPLPQGGAPGTPGGTATPPPINIPRGPAGMGMPPINNSAPPADFLNSPQNPLPSLRDVSTGPGRMSSGGPQMPSISVQKQPVSSPQQVKAVESVSPPGLVKGSYPSRPVQFGSQFSDRLKNLHPDLQGPLHDLLKDKPQSQIDDVLSKVEALPHDEQANLALQLQGAVTGVS